MVPDNQPLPAAADERPDPSDQAIFLLRANRRYTKLLMTFVKTIRAFYPNKVFKKYIDAIDQTNRACLQALQEFERQLNRIDPPTPATTGTLQRVSDLFDACALLAYRTPPEKLHELQSMVDAFKSGNYTDADTTLVKAIQQAPAEANAQIGIVLAQHLPDLDKAKRNALALALEGLFSIRKQLNY